MSPTPAEDKPRRYDPPTPTVVYLFSSFVVLVVQHDGLRAERSNLNRMAIVGQVRHLTPTGICGSFNSIQIEEDDMPQAYCIKCRGKVEIKNPQKITMKPISPSN